MLVGHNAAYSIEFKMPWSWYFISEGKYPINTMVPIGSYCLGVSIGPFCFQLQSQMCRRGHYCHLGVSRTMDVRQRSLLPSGSSQNHGCVGEVTSVIWDQLEQWMCGRGYYCHLGGAARTTDVWERSLLPSGSSQNHRCVGEVIIAIWQQLEPWMCGRGYYCHLAVARTMYVWERLLLPSRRSSQNHRCVGEVIIAIQEQQLEPWMCGKCHYCHLGVVRTMDAWKRSILPSGSSQNYGCAGVVTTAIWEQLEQWMHGRGHFCHMGLARWMCGRAYYCHLGGAARTTDVWKMSILPSGSSQNHGCAGEVTYAIQKQLEQWMHGRGQYCHLAVARTMDVWEMSVLPSYDFNKKCYNQCFMPKAYQGNNI